MKTTVFKRSREHANKHWRKSELTFSVNEAWDAASLLDFNWDGPLQYLTSCSGVFCADALKALDRGLIWEQNWIIGDLVTVSTLDFFHKWVVAAEMFYLYCPFLVEANILIASVCYYEIKYIYIYSFSRCFYPKRLTIEEYNKRFIIKRQKNAGR